MNANSASNPLGGLTSTNTVKITVTNSCHVSVCPNCGVCNTPDYCLHCGVCKNCGKFHNYPIYVPPYNPWPYPNYPYYTSPTYIGDPLTPCTITCSNSVSFNSLPL